MDLNIGVTGVLYLVLPSALLGWLFRRYGLVDVAGFVIGGILSYILLSYFGVNVENLYVYTEPLQHVGLVLFFFEIGATLDIRGVARSSYFVASSELALLVLAWVTTGLISHILSLGFYERLVVFLLLLNSSTMAVVALHKLKPDRDIYERAVLQTSLEDLLQFALFSLLVAASPAQYPIEMASNLAKTAGSALLLFLVARYASKALSKSPLTASRVDKFFTLLSFAVLFSALASLLGLPELFGAFVSGLAVSLYFKLDEVLDLLSGLRDLGLLLYFAGIGLIIAPWLTRVNVDLAITVVVLTLIAIPVRFVGCSIGLTISGVSVYSSSVISLILSSISETGIVFTYMMFKAGVVSEELVAVTVFTVLATMIITSTIAPRAPRIASRIESVLPDKLLSALLVVSKVYQRRVELLVRVLTLLTWFSALVLATTTATSVFVEVADSFGIPSLIVSTVVAFSVFTLLAIHTLFVKKVSEIVIESAGKASYKPLRALEILADTLMGFFTMVLQTYLLGDYATRVAPGLPIVEVFSVYIAVGIAVIVTAYSVVKHVKSYRKR